MLPYDKDWLENEMHLIEAQTKKDKRKKKDTEIMRSCLFCLFVFFVSVANAKDHIWLRQTLRPIDDVKCDQFLEVKKGTWKCPNPKCRYVNDNRIRYCPLCGSERQ